MFLFFFFPLNAVRSIGRLFYFEHIAWARDLKNQLTAIKPPAGGRGEVREGTWVNFCLIYAAGISKPLPRL